MKFCKTCKEQIIVHAWSDEWRFDDFCSEDCYQKSDEWKSLHSRMNFFLDNLTTEQKNDLFIVMKDGYSRATFMVKIEALHDKS